MRAAVLEVFSEPLVLRDVPEPTPADDEVLVRVRATGLCGTDLKLCAGELGGADTLPLIPGHEVAGELVGGNGAGGGRVACYIYDTCGRCAACQSGQTTLCERATRIGLERDGGLAELVSVPRSNVLPFGSALGFGAAAVAMDAVATPWHALHTRAAVREGDTVVVVGAGGLGLNAIQIARLAGARVAAVDVHPDRRELAAGFGAECAVEPATAGELDGWSGGGTDIVLDSSGTPGGFETALAAARPGGRVVCCGYSFHGPYPLDSARVVLGELEIVGSRSATREDAAAALAAVESGHVKPPIGGEIALEEVNDALGRLREGSVQGRLVVDLQ
jgi:2-desacetyl-2-hydroxyethyl bacteriochlorophyllide A dehydrogenase